MVLTLSIKIENKYLYTIEKNVLNIDGDKKTKFMKLLENYDKLFEITNLCLKK